MQCVYIIDRWSGTLLYTRNFSLPAEEGDGSPEGETQESRFTFSPLRFHKTSKNPYAEATKYWSLFVNMVANSPTMQQDIFLYATTAEVVLFHLAPHEVLTIVIFPIGASALELRLSGGSFALANARPRFSRVASPSRMPEPRAVIPSIELHASSVIQRDWDSETLSVESGAPDHNQVSHQNEPLNSQERLVEAFQILVSSIGNSFSSTYESSLQKERGIAKARYNKFSSALPVIVRRWFTDCILPTVQLLTLTSTTRDIQLLYFVRENPESHPPIPAVSALTFLPVSTGLHATDPLQCQEQVANADSQQCCNVRVQVEIINGNVDAPDDAHSIPLKNTQFAYTLADGFILDKRISDLAEFAKENAMLSSLIGFIRSADTLVSRDTLSDSLHEAGLETFGINAFKDLEQIPDSTGFSAQLGAAFVVRDTLYSMSLSASYDIFYSACQSKSDIRESLKNKTRTTTASSKRKSMNKKKGAQIVRIASNKESETKETEKRTDADSRLLQGLFINAVDTGCDSKSVDTHVTFKIYKRRGDTGTADSSLVIGLLIVGPQPAEDLPQWIVDIFEFYYNVVHE